MKPRHLQTLRKKPVEIEAIQFDGTWGRAIEIMNWANGVYFVPQGYEHNLRRENELDRGSHNLSQDAPAFLVISTLEGDMRCDRGSWVLRGVQGEFYPCENSILEETYDVLTKEKF